MKHVFVPYCVWNIGCDYIAFTTRTKALEWLENNKHLKYIMGDRGDGTSLSTLDGMLRDGYAGVKEFEVDPVGYLPL